jgi:hypothetical protein
MAQTCPRCGHPVRRWRGFEWRTRAQVLGWPLVHVAFGRNRETGALLVARGIIAIGQFGIGLITIAQFGVGLLFGLGQVVGGCVALGQVALGLQFGAGQLATGMTAIGQVALGKYVLAQLGIGKYIWSTRVVDPEAVRHFQALWSTVRHLLGG